MLVPGVGLVEMLSPGPRERAVLLDLLSGKANKEIAYGLGITEATTKQYVYRLMEGTSTKSRHELVVWAMTYPEIFHGFAAPAGLHPRPCECPRLYCTMMRAATTAAPSRAA